MPDSFRNIQLPEFLHIAYYSGLVIMPSCKCSLKLKGENAEAAKIAYDSDKNLGLVNTSYYNKDLKKGCYVKIRTLNQEHNDIISLHVEGIARFQSLQKVKIADYKYECLYPDFTLYQNDYDKDFHNIDFAHLNPVLVKHFMMFLTELEMNDLVNKLDSISLDKFLNSLIMIMPMRDIERTYLSELPSLKEREDALSLLLQNTSNHLTPDSNKH